MWVTESLSFTLNDGTPSENVSLNTLRSNSKHLNANFTLENWACLIEGTNQQSNVRVDMQASCLHTEQLACNAMYMALIH